MTFWEALYGSQYYEIQQRGKDGNRGRFNGNILLTVFILILFFSVIMLLIGIIPEFKESLTKLINNVFGNLRGGTIGRLLTLPLLAIIYLIVSNTIGSKKQFAEKIDTFMQYPDDVKKKANAKVLIPFFAAFIIAIGLGALVL